MVNWSFHSFGKENVGEFTIANISYFSEYGIWLGKILVNDVHFTKVFFLKNFVLYSNIYSKVNTCTIHRMYYIMGFSIESMNYMDS